MPLARLAVLPILLGPGPDVTASEVFAAVNEAASLRRTLRVMSIDDYFFHEGGALANRALACGQDTSCIAKQLTPFDADLGLVVVLNLELSPPLLSIILLDTEKRSVVAEYADQFEGDTAALFRKLIQRTEELFDERGLTRAGRIAVDVDPPRAMVTITDRTPDRGAPNVFTVEAGTYTIHAAAEGFEPSETTTTVRSGATSNVTIQLVQRTSVFESPWTWTLAAIVVAGAIVGVTAAAVSSRTDCICVLTAEQRSCPPCP